MERPSDSSQGERARTLNCARNQSQDLWSFKDKESDVFYVNSKQGRVI